MIRPWPHAALAWGRALVGFAYKSLHELLLLARRNRVDRPVRPGPPHLPHKLDPALKARRLQELAKDAAHGGRIDPKNIAEAEAGLGMEERGLIAGPLKRSPDAEAEFVDAHGKYWDVKAFQSTVPGSRGGFTLSTALSRVRDELRDQHSVIIDTRGLHLEHTMALHNAVREERWMVDRVLFYHGDDI